MLVKDKAQSFFTELKDSHGFVNPMQSVKIQKIVVNVGTGKRSRLDRHFNELVADRLGKITGQKPMTRLAKKSIAGFKIRTGDPIGQIVTLRGERMYDFLNKLVNITLPRTKDFRGIKRASVDSMGNLSIGLKENSIFPETSNEDIKDIFGMSITVVTTAKTQDSAMLFFEHIGMPFAKVATK